MARSSSRDKIIEAAEKLVARVGAAHLTLDAVAEEAGVSKGGLLYHFKTKNELIEAILHEYISTKIKTLEEVEQQIQQTGSSKLEAHLNAFLTMLCGTPCDRETGVALLAVIANNPELMKPFEEHFDAIADRVWGKKSNFNPDAAILWLAAEGIRFFNLINHDPFNNDQREKVIARILEHARNIGSKT